MSAQFEAAEAETPPEDAEATSALPGFLFETDFAFYHRRAMEEARLAQRASCPRAASSHRYLAQVYSEKVRRELQAAAEFEDLLDRLS
ncbi:MAG TPA: hypothetical protein VF631_02695 [Allosphingosinicella sp.]|jgi:hypothetical protein